MQKTQSEPSNETRHGLCTILHGYEVKLEIALIGYPCMAIACMQVYFVLIVGIPVKYTGISQPNLSAQVSERKPL